MPDLSDLLKESIGDVPDFDAGALAARARRQRNRQIGIGGGLAALAAAITIALVVGHSNSGPGVAVRAGSGPSTDAVSTTVAPATTVVDATSTTGTQPTQATAVPPPPDPSIPTVTTVPGELGPQPGDFTGTVTARRTTVTVDAPNGRDEVDVDMWVRNVSDHVVDGSSAATTLGLMCAPLAGDGTPTVAVESDVNFWFAVIPPLHPGDEGGRSGTFRPTADDVGTVTCEAVIAHFDPAQLTLTFVAPVPGVTPLTITVKPAHPATTTSTEPTTTVPAS